MLEIAATVLLIAWILGLLSSYTLGGAIHLCLILALVLLAVKWLWKPAGGRGRSSRRLIG